MILKIEGADISWTFIGDVEECESRVIVCETEDGLDELRKNCRKDFTYPRSWDVNNRGFKWISYLRKGYDWGVALCQGQVFLLSDVGKTIERL